MLGTIYGYIGTLIEIYTYMLIAYVLLSWLPSAKESFIGEMLGKLCEPYLSIFRRFIPPIGGMIDISPIVALIALRFIGEGIRAVLSFFVR
ncbi:MULTISPECIES: YggT family protein [Paenibacillus]|uniref:YggT family protein n=1 Tax=Paenibacillus radicis (ex Xue et al. 2023) TaxID=2972489 RepID=A0ABT1YSJ7_9BACL|nr:YggT family protein [Paenibacillus radicis (ex Xue et al. 2023)]MCR8634950.1 YggT family protein [Paenibacillus radicis (ex Xue et al. 2023)]